MSIYIWILVGFMTGVFFFLALEGMKPSNSFYDTCWVRKQPNWSVHSKVYILGMILIWKGYSYSDRFLLFLGSAWIGLHLLQNYSEMYNTYINNISDIK